MVALTHFIIAASFAGLTAVHGLQITNPSSNSWWVADSANTLAWTCDDKTHDTFTILIGNSDPTILSAPIAIIAIQNNFDCSKLLTPEQVTQKAAPGYRVIFANPLNSTEVYAQSDVFEIKPLGSAYPSQPSSAGATPSGSAAASGASGAAPKPTNGATSLKNFGLGASAAIAAGLAYFM